MKFVKDDEEKRSDYILQKNPKTKFGVKFIVIVLALLIVGVIVSGLILGYF
ncbi:hypothetical protein ACWGOQ_0007080 [Aquimarina sp. M1]